MPVKDGAQDSRPRSGPPRREVWHRERAPRGREPERRGPGVEPPRPDLVGSGGPGRDGRDLADLNPLTPQPWRKALQGLQ